MPEQQQYTIGKNHFILCPAPIVNRPSKNGQ